YKPFKPSARRARLPLRNLHGTMGADSRDDCCAGDDFCCGGRKADLPTNSSKLASASFTLPSCATGSTGADFVSRRYSATSVGGCFLTGSARYLSIPILIELACF